MRLRFTTSVPLALAALAAFATAPAEAGTLVRANSYFEGGGPNVTFFLNGQNKGTFGAGAFSTQDFTVNSPYTATGSAYQTYCVDLFYTNNPSDAPPTLAYKDITSGIVNDGGGRARDLGYVGLLLNTAVTTNRNDRAALQVAIWKAAFDSGSTSITSGAYSFSSTAGVIAKAQSYLDAAHALYVQGYRASVGLLDYPPSTNLNVQTPVDQDQVFGVSGPLFVVPEPSTLAMGGLAGLALLGIRLRRGRVVRD